MANHIKTRREELKLSQKELAERIGVEPMTVSRWERGNNLPNKKHWPKIEETTGIVPSQLVELVKAAQ
jgi:transcriptional regulator with XRE-family HTH domain